MKVLRLIASMDPESGGPCQGIRNSCTELAKRGIVNEVVCTDSPGAAYLEKDDFKIHTLGPAKNPWAYSAKLKPWLRENISRFDAVIAHGLWLYPNFALYQVRKKRKKSGQDVPKCFVMPHGMLDPYFQKAPDRKLKALRNELYWSAIESNIIAHADGLLFTTNEELLLARQTFGNYKPRKEICVGYGINPPPSFQPELSNVFYKRVEIDREKPFLLFLSRIHPKKGVELLIEAYSNVLKETEVDKLPDLVIAGPGMDTPYGQQLKSQAGTCTALKEKIFFPGMLKGDAKWGAFYNCEAFLLPSHQENFGIAVAEALACEKPVLTTNKVNIWREIEEGEAGIISDDNLAEVEGVLRVWLKTEKAGRDKMAGNARRTYFQNFTVAGNMDRLIDALSGK